MAERCLRFLAHKKSRHFACQAPTTDGGWGHRYSRRTFETVAIRVSQRRRISLALVVVHPSEEAGMRPKPQALPRWMTQLVFQPCF